MVPFVRDGREARHTFRAIQPWGPERVKDGWKGETDARTVVIGKIAARLP